MVNTHGFTLEAYQTLLDLRREFFVYRRQSLAEFLSMWQELTHEELLETYMDYTPIQSPDTVYNDHTPYPSIEALLTALDNNTTVLHLANGHYLVKEF